MQYHGLAFAATLLAASVSARADIVSLSNITGTWFDANPGASITSNSGTSANAQIRWSASGYNFEAAANPAVNVPPSPSPDFRIGRFSHVNEPISSSITGVKLRINADISVDSGGVTTRFGNRSFAFQFTHDETVNADDPCAHGGANLQGANINGCADRVTVTSLDASETFGIGSGLYTVTLSGFEIGGVFTTAFLTAERTTNTADLLARVTLSNQVPEPGSLGLVGLSLLGLAAMRRRR